MNRARKKGITKLIVELEKQGPPPYGKGESDANDTVCSQLLKCETATCSEISFWEIFRPQEYSLLDSVRAIQLFSKAYEKVQPPLVDLGLEQEVPELKIPIFCHRET